MAELEMVPAEIKAVFQLTSLEWAALSHRLQVPDAIIDYLTDSDDHPYQDTDPQGDILGAVIECIERGSLSDAIAISAEATKDVLIDACEGSTWFGCVPKEETAARRSAERTLTNLGKKIGNYYGVDIDVPLH